MKACFHENNDIYRVHAYLLLFETATQPSSAQLKRKKNDILILFWSLYKFHK